MQPGELIAGKYRIERLLGAGGMGSVYVANNEVLQKRVALEVTKWMRPRIDRLGRMDAAVALGP